MSEGVDEFNPGVQVECVQEEEMCTQETAFENLFSAKTGMLMFVRKSVAPVTTSSTTSSSTTTNTSSEVFQQFSLLEDVSIPTNCFVYPGSYNPLHEGHISLAAAAMRLKAAPDGVGTSAPLVFEISALNADKPPLAKEEILRRVSQFAKGSAMDAVLEQAGITNVAVCVTSRPYFEGKAGLFPGCHFIMGADTLSRLFDPKYYGDSWDNMIASVSNITVGQKCSFIIGGRKDSAEESGFCDLSSVLGKVQLPGCVLQSLSGLTDEQFRFDISSTEIREAMKKNEDSKC
jgi:nicotinic acid mononucleotide adenylyltransferase